MPQKLYIYLPLTSHWPDLGQKPVSELQRRLGNISNLEVEEGEDRWGDNSQSLPHWPFPPGSAGCNPREELGQARTYFTTRRAEELELVLAKHMTHTARCLCLCICFTKIMPTEHKEVSEKLGPQIGRQELEISHNGNRLIKWKTTGIGQKCGSGEAKG